GQVRAIGEGELDLALVRIGHRDQPVARPGRAAHPLPVLDNLGIGLADKLSQPGEHRAAPIVQPRDHGVDLFGGAHAKPSPGSLLACAILSAYCSSSNSPSWTSR